MDTADAVRLLIQCRTSRLFPTNPRSVCPRFSLPTPHGLAVHCTIPPIRLKAWAAKINRPVGEEDDNLNEDPEDKELTEEELVSLRL